MLDISPQKVKSVTDAIDKALDNGASPIAAFDADGTLWNTDIGETFFQFQIKNKLLPHLPQSPWEYYRKMHDEDAPKAYMWLAQINKGHKLSTIREWAQAAFNEIQPLPLFTGVQAVINHLLKRKVEVYIVTASIQWSVEPGAVHLGIPRDNVIGVVTHVKDGVITDEPHGAVSWRKGKVTRLLEKTNNKHPLLAAGNTMGDLDLIESATHVKLANCGAPPESGIYETECKLVDIAKKNNWFYFTY